MKKTIFILILLANIVFVGCSNNTNQTNVDISDAEKLLGKKLTIEDLNLVLNEKFNNQYEVYTTGEENRILSQIDFYAYKDAYNKKIEKSNTLSQTEKNLKTCHHSYIELLDCSHSFRKFTELDTWFDGSIIIKIKLNTINNDSNNNKLNDEIFDVLKFLNANYDMSDYYYRRNYYRDIYFHFYSDEMNDHGQIIEDVFISKKGLKGEDLYNIVWENIDKDMLKKFIHNYKLE